MITRDTTRRSLQLGLALVAALALSACARNSADTRRPEPGFGAGGAGGIATPGSPQDFTVNVGDRVFFDSDSSELNSSAVATLDKQAQWLTRYSQYAFTVEGHADERGTREYNFALGARRAEAVKNYLSRPAASPATASARSPTARSGRSRSATTSAAGRRTAAA